MWGSLLSLAQRTFLLCHKLMTPLREIPLECTNKYSSTLLHDGHSYKTHQETHVYVSSIRTNKCVVYRINVRFRGGPHTKNDNNTRFPLKLLSILVLHVRLKSPLRYDLHRNEITRTNTALTTPNDTTTPVPMKKLMYRTESNRFTILPWYLIYGKHFLIRAKLNENL